MAADTFLLDYEMLIVYRAYDELTKKTGRNKRVPRIDELIDIFSELKGLKDKLPTVWQIVLEYKSRYG